MPKLPFASLQQTHPELAKEFVYGPNSAITPDTVAVGSNKLVLWRCPNDVNHMYVRSPKRKRQLKCCPLCSPRNVTSQNNLGVLHPNLAKQWHSTKNEPLTAFSVLPRSNKVVWWQCIDGHEWPASPDSRSQQSGTGCPQCHILRRQISVQQPTLASLRLEYDVSANTIKFESLTFASNKRVTWRCLKNPGHHWRTSVGNRIYSKTGCPYCSGRKVLPEDSLVVLHPKLASEWHPTKNADCTPYTKSPSSAYKAWWLCLCGNEWKTQVRVRVAGGKCPKCSGKSATDTNNLAVSIPQIKDFWHSTKNVKSPSDFLPRSNKKVWLQCPQYVEHIWSSTISNIHQKGISCLFCSNRAADSLNNLAVLYPLIAAEWHPTRNGELTPLDVVAGSSDRVWWLCRKSHEWRTTVVSRTTYETDCSKCCAAQTSKPEQRIFCELQIPFPMALNRSKISGCEIDILLPNEKIAIEYDGFRHAKAEERDNAKTKALKVLGYEVLRVRALPLQKLDDHDCQVEPSTEIIKLIYPVANALLSLMQRNDTTVKPEFLQAIEQWKLGRALNETQYRKAKSASGGPKQGKSLKDLRPEIADEWDYKENSPWTPEMFILSSKEKVSWICRADVTHKWQAMIKNRGKPNGTGCRHCWRLRRGRKIRSEVQPPT